MTLFQCKNHPIPFHIFDIDDAERASLTKLILAHGGIITENENSLIKFTSSNADTKLYSWAKIYNIEFITECMKEKRLVEPERYRLGIKSPNDEYHMLHFLYGTCGISPIVRAESQPSSGTTDAFLSAQNSSVGNSINNLDARASRSNGIPENPVPLSVTRSPEVRPEDSPVYESTVSKRYASPAGGDVGENHRARNDEKRSCNLEYEHELRSHEMKIELMSSIDDARRQQNDASDGETDTENIVLAPIRTKDENQKESSSRCNNFEKPVSNDEPPSHSNLADDDPRERTTDVDSVPSLDIFNSDTPINHSLLKNPICTKNINGGSKVPNIRCKGLKRVVPDSIRSAEKHENRESDTFAQTSTSKKTNETCKKNTNGSRSFQSWICPKRYTAFYYDSSSSSTEDDSPGKKRSRRVNNSNTATSNDTVVILSSDAETFSDKSTDVEAKRKESRPRALRKVPVHNNPSSEDSNNTDVEHVYTFQSQRRIINEESKGAKWRAKLIPTNSQIPTRHPYTSWERRTMVSFLVDKNYIERCKGLTVWRDLMENGLLTNRTPQSLRNQFMKTILPSIEQAKFLDRTVLEKFLVIRNNIAEKF